MIDLKKEADFAIWCIPQVDTGSKSNCKHILRWPIDQVQVEVIL